VDPSESAERRRTEQNLSPPLIRAWLHSEFTFARSYESVDGAFPETGHETAVSTFAGADSPTDHQPVLEAVDTRMAGK
jgi:hypothetical protein